MRPDRPDGVSLRHYDGLGAVWTVKKASGRHLDPFGTFRMPFGLHRVFECSSRAERAKKIFKTTFQQMFQHLQ